MSLLKLIPLSLPLNHAYLVIGGDSSVLDLKNYLDQRFGEGYTSSANPDFSLKMFETWGVDESRALKEFSANRPVAWPAKTSIIVPGTITSQAQNSLLKTLEEPTPDTHFFILAKNLGEYLPTVISRCQVVRLEPSVFSEELIGQVEEFLVADIYRRYEINKEIVAKQEDDINIGVDWLNCLFGVYWNKYSDRPNEKIISGAGMISNAIFYAGSRGSSLRLILDHLAGVVSVG
jgi:hypothetical protein